MLNPAMPLYQAHIKPSTGRQLAFSNEGICQAQSCKNKTKQNTTKTMEGRDFGFEDKPNRGHIGKTTDEQG